MFYFFQNLKKFKKLTKINAKKEKNESKKFKDLLWNKDLIWCFSFLTAFDHPWILFVIKYSLNFNLWHFLRPISICSITSITFQWLSITFNHIEYLRYLRLYRVPSIIAPGSLHVLTSLEYRKFSGVEGVFGRKFIMDDINLLLGITNRTGWSRRSDLGVIV